MISRSESLVGTIYVPPPPWQQDRSSSILPTATVSSGPLGYTHPSSPTKEAPTQHTRRHPCSAFTTAPGMSTRWHRCKAPQYTLGLYHFSPRQLTRAPQQRALWYLSAHAHFGSCHPSKATGTPGPWLPWLQPPHPGTSSMEYPGRTGLHPLQL